MLRSFKIVVLLVLASHDVSTYAPVAPAAPPANAIPS
jgi:hypothetical protein